MNKFFKVALICFGTNLLFILLMFVNPSSDSFITIGLLWILYLVIQFIVGLVFIFQKRHNELGKGILLGMSISLLIGFSICSTAGMY